MQINQHLELGKINTLVVDRITDPGLFLKAADEKDVLLPNQYVTPEMEVGSSVDVFLYTDSEDRLVASTVMPRAMLDEYGFFEVVDTTKFGAFVEWGLPKDLFVPKNAQKTPFKVGDKRILHVSYDEQSHRLIGEEKLTKYLSSTVKGLRPGSEVALLLMARTPMGYKVIVNHRYEGMIFSNEIFEKVAVGDTKRGYVKTVRPDGKLDISLQPIGAAKTDAASEKVMSLLDENGGILPYNYKSDADLVQKVFGLSKKNYKRALTQLQDAGKIEVKENGIFRK
jgi:hypothetical protein